MQVPDPMDATIADYVHAATCIKAENDELIASVYHIPSLLTRKCWVAVNSTDGRFNFRLVEEVKVRKIEEILGDWAGCSGIATIPDVFKDKLDYNVTSWDKLLALNTGMLPVLQQYYNTFSDAKFSKEAAVQFTQNYAVLRDAILDVRSTLHETPSQEEAAQAAYAEVTDTLARIQDQFNVTIASRNFIASLESPVAPPVPSLPVPACPPSYPATSSFTSPAYPASGHVAAKKAPVHIKDVSHVDRAPARSAPTDAASNSKAAWLKQGK
jgi:hypothetical protein